MVPIRWIEDLRDAVHGAGLQATQRSRGPLSGSLAFAEQDGVLYSTGRLQGRVAMSGPLSREMATVGLGLRLPSGTRHWRREVTAGNLGLFLPGDEHDSLYMPDSLYLMATIGLERLDYEAGQEDLVLDRGLFVGSGVHRRTAPPGVSARASSRPRRPSRSPCPRRPSPISPFPPRR